MVLSTPHPPKPLPVTPPAGAFPLVVVCGYAEGWVDGYAEGRDRVRLEAFAALAFADWVVSVANRLLSE